MSNLHHSIRVRTGIKSGIMGLVINILLVIIKLVAGLTANSVAILADAMNSLGDGLSSILTIGGFYIASKPADRQHPFGHQRAEYISGLFTAIIILFVGFQFLIVSIDKIFNPVRVESSTFVIILLLISMLMKSGLAIYFYQKNKNLPSKSTVISSLMKDSFYDVVINILIIISYIVEIQFGWYIDGYAGVVVAVFILIGGTATIIESANDLIGTRPNTQIVQQMQEVLDSYESLVGYHDLVLHKYGPNKLFATVDIEVDSRWDLLEAHRIIDTIEVEFKEKFNIILVSHLDPIVLDDDEQNKIYLTIKKILKSYDENYHFHDLRIEEDNDKKVILFDVVVPNSINLTDEELNEKILHDLKIELNQEISLNIEYDRNYILSD